MLKILRSFLLGCLLGLGLLIGTKLLLLRNKVFADPAIQPHITEFFRQQKLHHTEIETFYGLYIYFNEYIIYPTAGVSYDSYSKVRKVIFINRFIWQHLTDLERTELIAHELGHSLLHRDHTTMILPDKDPVSIMNPSLFLERTFLSHEEYYWSELFSKQNDLPKGEF